MRSPFGNASRFSTLVSALALGLLCSACVVGAPPGFSDGDLWEVPLIAPLENDHYLVPVSLNGQGPYVFMVDPDAIESSIDDQVRGALNLRNVGREDRPTEEDHLIPVLKVQLNKMTLGDLSIRNMVVRVHPTRAFWSSGRRVHGVLGRDVIADSLIFKFDRDAGKMYIATQDHLAPAPEAKTIGFSQNYTQPRRYLHKVTINKKHKVSLHMDLGARTSMLWPRVIDKLKLPKIPVQARVTDEYAISRDIQSATIGGIVDVTSDLTANALLFLPYDDQRLETEDLDGILGQNFWSKFNLTINWHKKTIYLQDRDADLAAKAAERVARWGDRLNGCETLACVRFDLLGKPTPEAPVAAPVEGQGAAEGEVEGEGVAATVVEGEEGAPEGNGAPGTASAGPEADAASQAPGAASTNAAGQAPGQVVSSTPLGLNILREGAGVDLDFDVLVMAVDAEGKRLREAPLLVASFKAGVASLSVPRLGAEFEGVEDFKVLDIAPVGMRPCDGRQCVFPLKIAP